MGKQISMLLYRIWNRLPLSEYWRWRILDVCADMVLPFLGDSSWRTRYVAGKKRRSQRIRPAFGDVLPPLPMPTELPDVYVFGIIDWHLRLQRPQHLARLLAERGHRVFYLSPEFVNTGRDGFEMECLGYGGRLIVVRFQVSVANLQCGSISPALNSVQYARGLAALHEWVGQHNGIGLIQHPAWGSAVSTFFNEVNVYDCMDLHVGFPGADPLLEDQERMLLARVDLTVASSSYLAKHLMGLGGRSPVTIIRNGVEYGHFSVAPPQTLGRPDCQAVIGYYGAIADWFDLELVRDVAALSPDFQFVLVGADTCGAAQYLENVPNVSLVGEVSYQRLPYYLYGFDVCILPFRAIPLTLATNPVKVYEYFAAGRPVVATPLPEMAQFGDLVLAATGASEFRQKLCQALATDDPDKKSVRRAFAQENDWAARVDAMLAAVASLRGYR